ncbi:hypothetical protein ASE00_09205 [Sphingomonas sp. Root710]|uniref:MgtC/SapB family protein n=1 Tax=Sphingomonas sp. Root710 TaxID=1736594 RepID=UPI0006FE37C4|nr:MgtC/SapB family protein [Sphingomonas sp. Root710]KRB82256.1 hypothetical protein ASE00_09205 [Sphingomonas sp. Root710]
MNVDGLEYVALGLALGFLIGIERGWSSRSAIPGTRVAGIRTFALLGLTGALCGALATGVHIAIGAGLFVATAGLIVIGYRRSVIQGASVSATGAIAMLLTLGIGLLAATGQPVLASVSAAIMTLILSMREQLHGWIERLDKVELQAIARFALIALAILPLLPDRDMGPFDAWNPHQLWIMVVLVSGLSFIGYFVSKWLGPSRGIIATAAAGAMISSTAVTASLATRLRAGELETPSLIAGVAAASAVMFMRVLVMAAMLAPFALPWLAAVIGAPAMVSLLCTGWFLRRTQTGSGSDGEIAVRNPFAIWPALMLVGLVMFLSVVANAALLRFGDAGLATALAISGMIDVDSAIITMGGLPAGAIDGRTAGLVLSLPVLLNTLVKAVVAISIAGWRAGWPAALPLILSAAAAFLALPWIL